MKIFAAVIAAIAIPALFLAGDSSAASSSYTYTSSDNLANLTIYDPSNNTLGFTPSYYKVEVIPVANATCSLLQQSISAFIANDYNNSPYSPNTDCSYRIISTFPNSILKFGRYLSFRSDIWDSIIITFYDIDPAVSTPCPECPEIPDLPYGEKLDHLTAAIIFVPATMLVIYFMFAIYSMFFRGLK